MSATPALTGLLLVVGCASWPIAVNDGLPAQIPGTGQHEIRLGLHTLFPPPTSRPNDGIGAYLLMAYRTGFDLGPLALELGAGGVTYTEDASFGILSSYKSDMYVVGPEIALGWKNPAITLRAIPGGAALNAVSDYPDSHASLFLEFWPQATLLWGFSGSRRPWSGSMGLRASRSAVGPVLLCQFSRDEAFIRPEVSFVFRSPWADSTIADRQTVTIGFVAGLNYPHSR